MPKVSIGIPLYNGERHLAQTLDSLLGQTFMDFEIVISDNASTDASGEICRAYEKRDARVKYFRNEANIGAARNFNKVFELSSGPYFRWNSHDDLIKHTNLEKCVAVLNSRPDVVLCQPRTVLIGDDGSDLVLDATRDRYTDGSGGLFIEGPDPAFGEADDPIDRFIDVYEHAIRCMPIYGLMRRDVLARTSVIKFYFMADRGLLLEMSLYGRFHEIPEVLFLKRDHPGNAVNLPSDVEKALWQDPYRRPPWRFPNREHYLHNLASLIRAPFSLVQKARGVGYVLRKVPWSKLWAKQFQSRLREQHRAQALSIRDTLGCEARARREGRVSSSRY